MIVTPVAVRVALLAASLVRPVPTEPPVTSTVRAHSERAVESHGPTVQRVGSAGRLTRITGTVVWQAGAAIELEGPLVVAPGGTLVIHKGTRVEARVGAYIAIARDGSIDARGTVHEPIELTCTATARYPGCWGGLIVHGYARINHGTATSPASPTRSPTGDCLEASDPVVAQQRYGGCNDADNSGTLRFLRIEYAERGLHLAGVGSGTEIIDVQANRSRGEGVLVTGGMASARELFLTANGTGLRWTGGWRGQAQWIVVQQDIARFAAGIVGQNGTTTAAATADALPRSAPVLYNLTVVAQSVPANPTHATARAIVLDRGTAGTLRNVMLYAPHIALDIAAAATCTQLGTGALSIRNVLTAGATSVGEGTVPVGCPTEAGILNDAAAQNLLLPGAAGLLVSENDLILPDLRPVQGSPLALATAAIPPGPFFRNGVYLGAVPPIVGGSSTLVPWFSGWTSPAPQPAPIPEGTIRGVVRSPVRGLIAGALVTDATTGASALSAANGSYELTLPAGTALLDVTLVPSGCVEPATRAGTVQPNDLTTLDLIVGCAPLPGVERISAGDGFACGLADQGTFCWGDNAFGQLGDGTTTASLLPTSVATAFTSLSAGTHHVCGREPNGIVRCWGRGTEGQLGDGTGTNRSSPAPGPGGPFQLVTAGGAHTCALSTDGAAYCWGSNAFGQLGTGGASSAMTPVPVSGGRSFATLAAGKDHTCGLDLTGAAWCWGANARGQLGDGTMTDRAVPVAVVGGQVFAALAGGGDAHTCATNATGTVRCWGANEYGQLGSATSALSLVPGVVQTTLSLSNVTLGDQHSCGINAESVVLCWGRNSDGQIGNGFTTPVLAPVPVNASARFNRITGGAAFTCGVTFGAVTGEDNVIVISRRSLLCWGRNSTGQYGRNSTVPSLTPAAAATGLTFP